MTTSDSRIIVALDYPSADQAQAFVDRVRPELCRLKVGKELFTRSGPEFVRQLVDSGFDVFLDLKYHDIPNTTAAACRAAADLGVWMMNVHASGGKRMMSAAKEALTHADHQPLLIAVTVLTSLADEELRDIGIQTDAAAQVLRLAGLAAEAGLDGVVCSPQETTVLRDEIGPEFALITPGIRPQGDSADDQRRITTPAQAIAPGSHYLVIGRPITQADDPIAKLESIQTEIN